MDIQAAFVFEVHMARGTIERSIRTVNINVPSQFVSSLEFLSTNLTLVSNFVWLVDLLVSLQLIQPCKALSTLAAFVWFFPSVNFDMSVSVEFGNCLQANGTFEMGFHDYFTNSSANCFLIFQCQNEKSFKFEYHDPDTDTYSDFNVPNMFATSLCVTIYSPACV